MVKYKEIQHGCFLGPKIGSLIFRNKYCLPEALEHPEVGTPAPSVMEVRDRRPTNASKQRT